MQSLLKAHNLNYKNILKDINVEIKKGSITAISGANKCGKTTLIKLLSGLIESESSIVYKKSSLEAMAKTEIDKKIGFIIPSIKMPFLFTKVEQELMYILDNLRLDKDIKQKQYQKIISLLNLKEVTLEDPANLNEFLKTKLLLAMAIISEPEILFLDDICAMLTKEETKEVLSILKVLKKEEKITIVMTTSNLEETLVADFLYIMNNGSFILKGTPLEILKEDSKLNKMGLTLPFMVDLSLKLRYYELVENIETDMDRLVDILWK